MRAQSSIWILIVGILSLLVVLNIAWVHSVALGVPSVLLLALVVGNRFGNAFFASFGHTVRTALGALLAVAWIMILGSVFYYVAVLNELTISIIFVSLFLLSWLLGGAAGWLSEHAAQRPGAASEASRLRLPIIPKIILGAALIVFLVLAHRILDRAKIFDSTRSPWEVLPWQFFLYFFLAGVALILLALTRNRIAIAAAIPFFFLFYAVTAFTYPLGYGFDPFVHQATESYIADHGTITPKPFTYIGQYALVVTTHRATALPIDGIDRWLLPVLLAIFVPIVGFVTFRAPLAAVLLPILPVSTFAVTTPQAIANALVLITILLAIATRDGPRRVFVPLWLLGVATALTHPIAGVPLLIFLFIWTLRAAPVAPRRILTVLATIIGSILLPILFVLYGLVGGSGTGLRSDWLARIPLVIDEFATGVGGLESRFNPLLDFVYLYGLNLVPLLTLVAIVVAVVSWKKKVRWPAYLLLAALITTANGILLQAGIDFSFLPLYEQSGYAARLFDIAALFLLPLFVIGFAWSIETVIKKHGLIVRAGTIAFFAGLLTASLYLTYPHPDAYTVERGFNVEAADFEAVKFIEQDAAGAPYIVLANQAVSAAALKEFGFKQYFEFRTDDGPVTNFYYPIPTGGPLYDYYLRMVYESPRSATVRDAMDRAGVGLGYFAVNRYWYQSEKIIEQAKGQTNNWWTFGNEQVFVFRFVK